MAKAKKSGEADVTGDPVVDTVALIEARRATQENREDAELSTDVDYQPTREATSARKASSDDK